MSYSPGLKDAVAAETRLSHVDGEAGELAECRPLSGTSLGNLRNATTERRSVIDAVRMAVASLPSTDDESDARRLVAGLPSVVAAYWRLLQGKQPIEPDPGLGHVANLLYMLYGEHPGDERVRALTTYLNTVIKLLEEYNPGRPIQTPNGNHFFIAISS